MWKCWVFPRWPVSSSFVTRDRNAGQSWLKDLWICRRYCAVSQEPAHVGFKDLDKECCRQLLSTTSPRSRGYSIFTDRWAYMTFCTFFSCALQKAEAWDRWLKCFHNCQNSYFVRKKRNVAIASHFVLQEESSHRWAYKRFEEKLREKEREIQESSLTHAVTLPPYFILHRLAFERGNFFGCLMIALYNLPLLCPHRYLQPLGTPE